MGSPVCSNENCASSASAVEKSRSYIAQKASSTRRLAFSVATAAVAYSSSDRQLRPCTSTDLATVVTVPESTAKQNARQKLRITFLCVIRILSRCAPRARSPATTGDSEESAWNCAKKPASPSLAGDELAALQSRNSVRSSQAQK